MQKPPTQETDTHRHGIHRFNTHTARRRTSTHINDPSRENRTRLAQQRHARSCKVLLTLVQTPTVTRVPFARDGGYIFLRLVFTHVN